MSPPCQNGQFISGCGQCKRMERCPTTARGAWEGADRSVSSRGAAWTRKDGTFDSAATSGSHDPVPPPSGSASLLTRLFLSDPPVLRSYPEIVITVVITITRVTALCGPHKLVCEAGLGEALLSPVPGSVAASVCFESPAAPGLGPSAEPLLPKYSLD